MYLALENWAAVKGCRKMKAEFVSNVDPDDAAAVLARVDMAHSLFIVVSKSGTTLETLTKNISHLGKVSNDFSLFGRF